MAASTTSDIEHIVMPKYGPWLWTKNSDKQLVITADLKVYPIQCKGTGKTPLKPLMRLTQTVNILFPWHSFSAGRVYGSVLTFFFASVWLQWGTKVLTHFHKMAPFCLVDILIPFPCLQQPLSPKINVEFWTLKSFFLLQTTLIRGVRGFTAFKRNEIIKEWNVC